MKKDAILFSACKYTKSRLNINDLPGGKYDVAAFGKRLRQIDFEVSIKEDAIRDEYIPALRENAKNSPNDAVHIVYFSGHGGHLNGHNYIFPSDFGVIYDSSHSIDEAGINIEDILNVYSGHGRLILILDACRSDVGTSRGYFSEITSFENVYIAYGTQFQDTSTGVNNAISWFTEGICDEILTPNIDIDALFTKVRRNVCLKHRAQIPSSVNALLESVVLHEDTSVDDIDTKVYAFVEKYGNTYNDKYGYFHGDDLIFIDAAQYFDISLLDTIWKYHKVSNSLFSKKGVKLPLLSEVESKIVTFLAFTKGINWFSCDENYTWYYNGRQIRMGEIPPLPPSMQQKLPEPEKAIVVEMKCSCEKGMMTIAINLPNGCEFFVGHSKVVVRSGKAILPAVNKSDTITIDSRVFSEDENIKRILGEKSRNLTGPLIKYNPIYGNHICHSFCM